MIDSSICRVSVVGSAHETDPLDGEVLHEIAAEMGSRARAPNSPERLQ